MWLLPNPLDLLVVPIKGFSSHMISDVRKWFLDPENILFDTFLTSLCGILTVLDNFPSSGIMEDTEDAQNAIIKVFSSSYFMSENESLTLKTNFGIIDDAHYAPIKVFYS